MPQFVNEGFSLHYEIHGTGRPVVLLHGGTVSFAGNYAAFGWIERLTAQGLQVIGLDFRGHGKSDKPHETSAYGTEPMARDVIALLDNLGFDRASFVGYSVGSAIALHLLHTDRARTDRSVLIATGDGLIGIPPYTFAEVNPRVINALRYTAFPKDLPPHVSAYWTFATKVGGDRIASIAGASASYPPCSLEEAASIKVPVLIVSGEFDPVLGRGPQLAKALPEGRYVEIAGADHFTLSRDERAQTVVAEFLAGSA